MSLGHATITTHLKSHNWATIIILNRPVDDVRHYSFNLYFIQRITFNRFSIPGK
ncbi:hypothetical protein [Klebsiella aerogenes]|uniref:hypothetical protein n=1 Tax=Klebsiella aerogenes TaxID=548 RepID=UPI00292D30B5|nr:hypothetical protein [Klebsiella aerogenes]